MKKKNIIIITSLLLSIIIIFLSFKIYNYLRIKYAKIEVILKEDLTAEFNEKKKISDYITSINGNIINDEYIDTTVVGNKDVTFNFINEDNIKVSYTYQIEIKDTVEPLIWLGNSYSIPVNSDIKLEEKILCGDNYDNNPNCYIEGEYNLNEVGSYPLVFKAIDSSGNTEEVEFTLNVYEPKKGNTVTSKKINTDFNDVIKNYKNDDTKIGIDVSSWQEDIDFEKIKASGVEFIMIRVGGTKGTNGEYFLDKKFKQNIEEANKYGIDAGIYFYSYANSVESAIRDAKWVLKQIKNYKIDLPIAFDWEEWSSFNEYNLSFFKLTSIAEAFLKTVEDAGYQGMLYSSKAYLEKIWLETDYDIWLAHYTSQTNYTGKYKMWQLCDNGKVDGISGNVDIDIMYK